MSSGGKWTEDQIERLRALHAEKLSGALIAARLGSGFSRNAVIGKLHRLGLSNAWSRVHRDNQRPRKPKKENRKTIRIVRANGNSNRLRVMESAETDLQALRCVEVVPRGVGILDLEAGECRYPDGEGPFTFCGHACREGKSYCPPHDALSRAEPRKMTEAGREKRRRTMRANFKLPLMEAAE